MDTHEERISKLERLFELANSKISDLSNNTEEKPSVPYTKMGGRSTRAGHHPYDVRSQLGGFGGTIYWNDMEVGSPFGEEPEVPTEGYHKHTHSRFSGGALINGGIEIVEYTNLTNKHSQQFISEEDLEIATVERGLEGAKETVPKIGLLDLIFNPDGGYDAENNPIGTWGVATYGIDVEKCMFVKKRTTAGKDEYGYPITGQEIGAIEKDANDVEMISPLFVAKEDGTQDMERSSVVWDINGKCWRLFATYAVVPEEAPEPEPEP